MNERIKELLELKDELNSIMGLTYSVNDIKLIKTLSKLITFLIRKEEEKLV